MVDVASMDKISDCNNYYISDVNIVDIPIL